MTKSGVIPGTEEIAQIGVHIEFKDGTTSAISNHIIGAEQMYGIPYREVLFDQFLQLIQVHKEGKNK